MGQVIHLVNERSQDTIQLLERLLSEARTGQLIGLAYAVLYRKRRYTVGATGAALENPTFSRGMVAVLDEFLSGEIG